jgi:hypothetical protein
MSADQPELSVVIPCYNVARWLPQALESVFSQRGVDLEVIVIDDGSPDDIAGVCKPFEPAIRYMRQENAGVAAARNRGIEMARGRYLHCLDGDDWVAPGAYASMVKPLRANASWAVATCASRFVREDGTPTSYVLLPPPTGRMFRQFARSCAVLPGSTVCRRSILERTGLYDLELKGTEDWDLILRIARTGAVFGCVNRENYNYRQHPASASRSPLRMFKMSVPVLERARRADPRVKDPDPEFAQGVDGADLPDRLARYAAVGLGRALGSDQVDEACELLELYIKHLEGRRPTDEHLRALFWEAGVTRGIVPPTHRETARACWPSLLEVSMRFKDRTDATEIMGQVAETLFGTALLQGRLQEFERSVVFRSARWLWRRVRPYWPRKS